MLIAAVWLVLLPWLGRQAPLADAIDRRDALGVNAEAMFYTELEAMETLVIEWNAETE